MHGIWFVEEDCCKKVYELTQKLIAEQENASAAASTEIPTESERGLGGLANLLSKAALKNNTAAAAKGANGESKPG